MIKQYPHTVEFTTTTGSTQNSEGDWTGGTTTTVQKPGRFEPAKDNATLAGADGTSINYQGIVYMPLPQDPLAIGSQVTVKKDATVLLNGTIKQFSAGQLNARIWL